MPLATPQKKPVQEPVPPMVDADQAAERALKKMGFADRHDFVNAMLDKGMTFDEEQLSGLSDFIIEYYGRTRADQSIDEDLAKGAVIDPEEMDRRAAEGVAGLIEAEEEDKAIPAFNPADGPLYAAPLPADHGGPYFTVAEPTEAGETEMPDNKPPDLSVKQQYEGLYLYRDELELACMKTAEEWKKAKAPEDREFLMKKLEELTTKQKELGYQITQLEQEPGNPIVAYARDIERLKELDYQYSHDGKKPEIFAGHVEKEDLSKVAYEINVVKERLKLAGMTEAEKEQYVRGSGKTNGLKFMEWGLGNTLKGVSRFGRSLTTPIDFAKNVYPEKVWDAIVGMTFLVNPTAGLMLKDSSTIMNQLDGYAEWNQDRVNKQIGGGVMEQIGEILADSVGVLGDAGITAASAGLGSLLTAGRNILESSNEAKWEGATDSQALEYALTKEGVNQITDYASDQVVLNALPTKWRFLGSTLLGGAKNVLNETGEDYIQESLWNSTKKEPDTDDITMTGGQIVKGGWLEILKELLESGIK